jgi:hypothetical protein
MVGEGIIDIAPEYQRQFRWKEDRQSVLIESIFWLNGKLHLTAAVR